MSKPKNIYSSDDVIFLKNVGMALTWPTTFDSLMPSIINVITAKTSF